MNPLIAYGWPGFAAGALIGPIVATIMFRKRLSGLRKWMWIGAAVTLAIAAALLWSGPLGAARQYIDTVERDAVSTLKAWEVPQIDARLRRAPLTRQLSLSGPADEFQRTELVRIMGNLPGVSNATWNDAEWGGLPLVVEGILAAIAGFLLGMFLAYLYELHRRYNAQWHW